MTITAQELIDHLATLPPTEPIWYSLGTKEDLIEYFVEGCEISDADFSTWADEFSGDWEYCVDNLRDIMDSKYLCDECDLYDYNAKTTDDNETLCRHCGEEEEIIYKK